MATISVNPKTCVREGICAGTPPCENVCPEHVFVQKERDAVPDPVYADLCTSCGHCAAICPTGAISLGGPGAEAIREMDPAKVPSYDQLMALLQYRRSYRDFSPKNVDKETIQKIIDAARFAPTAFNNQSTKYLSVHDILLLNEITETTAKVLEDVITSLRSRHSEAELKTDIHYHILLRMIAEGLGGNDPILHNASALLLFHADKNANMASINANLACQNAALAAETLGVGAFYTGFILLACRHDARINTLLGIPKDDEISAGLALGYPKVRFSKWIERKPANVTWR